MSANNQLVIVFENNRYNIYMHYCVDNPFDPIVNDIIKVVETLHEAIDYCNTYCRNEIVEYGYRVE